MNRITSASQLKEYALRKLGEGVVSVDVTTTQLQDRLDDALQMFGKYHNHGYEQYHLLLEVEVDEPKYDIEDENVLDIIAIIPNVTHVLNEPSFDLTWDFMQQRTWVGERDLVGYEMLLYKLKLIDQMVITQNGFIFNQVERTINFYPPPDYNGICALKTYRMNDSADAAYQYIFDDDWLKKYYTTLIEIQWAMNLTKFINVPLTGNGAVLNMEAKLERALAEKEKYELELTERFSEPIDFSIG